jgi:hypothetical protein
MSKITSKNENDSDNSDYEYVRFGQKNKTIKKNNNNTSNYNKEISTHDNDYIDHKLDMKPTNASYTITSTAAPAAAASSTTTASNSSAKSSSGYNHPIHSPRNSDDKLPLKSGPKKDKKRHNGRRDSGSTSRSRSRSRSQSSDYSRSRSSESSQSSVGSSILRKEVVVNNKKPLKPSSNTTFQSNNRMKKLNTTSGKISL